VTETQDEETELLYKDLNFSLPEEEIQSNETDQTVNETDQDPEEVDDHVEPDKGQRIS